MKSKLKNKKVNSLKINNPILIIGLLVVLAISIIIILINIFGLQNIKNSSDGANQVNNLISDNINQFDGSENMLSITPTISNTVVPSITLKTTSTVVPTHTVTPKLTNRPTSSPLPTYTTVILSPGQVGPNCPSATSNCVSCNTSDYLCRFETGKTSGFQGCSCQNNNPGNIRPAAFKNTIIINNGGIAPCGQRTLNNPSGGQGDYMVFRTFTEGKNALKAYIKGIALGQHSSYIMPSANFNCGECSLKQFFSKYAGGTLVAQDSPTSYANNVANWIGVNSDTTTLNWIVANKLDQFADAIQRQEGWFVN